jgi:mono/diheme cytochrome c family protein
VQGAGCGVRSAVPRAGCCVPGAVQSAVQRAVRRGQRGTRISVLLVGLCLHAVVLGAQGVPAGPASDLPASEGAEAVRARCLSCHGADLITSQRLSEAGWGRELDKMVRWGASVTDAERPQLVAYLATHFAPAPVAAHTPAAQGEAVFTRSCLSCHGADLTEQQRLSPSGWMREVEKMMRWGAQLSDPEKVTLVDYLAGRFPAR